MVSISTKFAREFRFCQVLYVFIACFVLASALRVHEELQTMLSCETDLGPKSAFLLVHDSVKYSSRGSVCSRPHGCVVRVHLTAEPPRATCVLNERYHYLVATCIRPVLGRIHGV